MSDETERQEAHEEAANRERIDAVGARWANGGERQFAIDALEQIYVNRYLAGRKTSHRGVWDS